MPVDLWDVDWVLETGRRLGVVVAFSNAKWAISDHGESNPNRVLLYGESGESGTVLRLPVSEGRRGPRTPPDESPTTIGRGADTPAHTGSSSEHQATGEKQNLIVHDE